MKDKINDFAYGMGGLLVFIIGAVISITVIAAIFGDDPASWNQFCNQLGR